MVEVKRSPCLETRRSLRYGFDYSCTSTSVLLHSLASKRKVVYMTNTTQAEKFTAAQAAVKAFIVKHGNVLFLGEGTKAEKLKQKFYSLQDAASDAYWTDEMDTAVRGDLGTNGKNGGKR